MSEVKHKAQAVQIEYVCDSCQTGTMALIPGKSVSVAYLSSHPFPTQYRHRCDHCGKEQDFPQCYPTVRYERAGAEPAPPKGPRYVVERFDDDHCRLYDTADPNAYGGLLLPRGNGKHLARRVADLLNREATS